MLRVLMVLLLTAPAFSQGDDAQALDPNTAPSKRQELQKRIASTDEGAARLARFLGDRSGDAAVKHEVVDVLFSAEKAVERIEPIIRLLLSEDSKLRAQIARRIQRAAEDAAGARKMLVPLRDIVLGIEAQASKEPRLRLAAVRALGEVPRRAAVELIVEAWEQDKHPEVREECRLELQKLIIANTPDEARAWLGDLKYHTYVDLQKALVAAMRKQIDPLIEFMREVLKKAEAERCIEVLAGDDPERRRIVAARMRELAQQARFGKLGAGAFADAAFAAFERERDSKDGDPKTVASLVLTLKELATGGENPPLGQEQKQKALAAALEPLAAKGAGWGEAGLACVELLGAVGAPAVTSLVPFAARSRSTDVRTGAIDKLGKLAREGTKIQDFIGEQLAGLLEKEKVPAVRRTILFNLRDAPVERARQQIEALLEAGNLVVTEDEYCVEILRKLGSKEALDALVKLARRHPREGSRLFAVRDGLLMRKYGEGDEKRVLAELETIVLSEQEPMSLRQGVVAAVGEKGGRGAYELLHNLSGLDAFKDSAGKAKANLAERLAGDPKGRGDLRTATRALIERAGGDFDRLDKLAQTILASGKQHNINVESARYYRAKLYQARKDKKEAQLLKLFKEAADDAQRDQLDPKLHIQLCLEFKALLMKGERDKASLGDAIACLKKLAELAVNEQAKAAGYYLEAAGIATDDLKDRVQAEALLKLAQEKGAEAAQLEVIRKRVEALPKPS